MTTAFNDIRLIIESEVDQNYSSTDVQYENVNYEPTSGNPYVKLFIDFNPTNLVGLGASKRYRYFGLITFQCLAPINQGSKKALEIADELATLFRYKKINGVITQAPSVVGSGNQTGSWYSVLVTIPFYYDELGE